MSIDSANKYLTAAQNIVVIVGLVFTAWSVHELVLQTKIQNQTMAQTQEVNSADYALLMENRLDSSKYDALYNTLEYGNQNTRILSSVDGGNGGSFRQAAIEDYIGNFDDLGTLVNDGVILPQMAYDDFSNQLEMAWCNHDIQNIIKNERISDHTKSALSDPYYLDFESLANTFLSKDGGCAAVEQ